MPTTCPITKNSVEKKRLEALNLKISEIQSILCPTTQNISRIEILELAVGALTGKIISNSSKPKGSSDRKEYKKEHEQIRRNKEKAAYDELKKFIIDKKLAGSSDRLEKNSILDIVINCLRSTATPTSSTTLLSALSTISSASGSATASTTPLLPPVVSPILAFPTPPPTPRLLTPPVSSLPFSISSILQNPFTPAPIMNSHN